MYVGELVSYVFQFRLTKMAVGNEQCTSGRVLILLCTLFNRSLHHLGLKGHWTKATSSHLVKLASNTDVTLGVKVMEEMLKLVRWHRNRLPALTLVIVP